ncbi:hypothetical protein ACFQ9X_31470 [Catenulispora yoronensis]
MSGIGTVLAEGGDHRHAPDPQVFLRSVNGSGVELLRHDTAAALLEKVTASPLTVVTGDLARGSLGRHSAPFYRAPRIRYWATPLPPSLR